MFVPTGTRTASRWRQPTVRMAFRTAREWSPEGGGAVVERESEGKIPDTVPPPVAKVPAAPLEPGEPPGPGAGGAGAAMKRGLADHLAAWGKAARTFATFIGRPLFVIAVPLGVVLAYYLLPEPLLATAHLDGMTPWCVTRTVGTASGPRPECPPPTTGEAAETKPAPLPTTAQLRSRELGARLGLATADAVVRLASLAAILLAVFCAWGMPSRADHPVASRLVAFLLVGVGIAAGVVLARHELPGDALRKTLIDGLLEQAQTAKVAMTGTLDDVRSALRLNLALGYAACGALLALLASLAVPAPAAAAPMATSGAAQAVVEGDARGPADTVPGRLVVLQAVMVVGALLFTASAYAGGRLIAWARVFLDQPAMKDAGEALDRLPELWGVNGSALLIAAVGVAYWAIREDGQSAARAGGSPVAFRTPDGQDLKFLGWLVNILLALAPAWAALKAAKLPDLPG